jgi:SAM-dependent methyltransferase
VKRALVPVELPPETLEAGSRRHTERTLLRYSTVEATPRLFARWKIRLDPMFPRLATFIKDPRRILDIGCGYAVPSVWLLELFPAATVCGLDPDEERVRVARSALGSRGDVRTGRAPDLADLPDRADTALVLDIIHMLGDNDLRETLTILHGKLLSGGRLVIRATIPRACHTPWMRRLEEFRLRRHRLPPHYRTCEALETMIRAAGFQIETVEPAAPRSEEWWFIAVRRLPEGTEP